MSKHRVSFLCATLTIEKHISPIRLKDTYMKGWLSVREAAEYCSVSVRTMRTWLKDNDFRYSCVGRKYLIKIEWLDGFLETHEVRINKVRDIIGGLSRHVT